MAVNGFVLNKLLEGTGLLARIMRPLVTVADQYNTS
jgi:hypothetical protein